MSGDVELDVLVVGAGPAGSSAALAAARGGSSTLIVDRRAVIGQPVRCGEYVPEGLRLELPEGVMTVAQRVSSLVLHLPSGAEHHMRSPGAVIDRARFDRAMLEAALAAGARVWERSPLVELGRGGVATIGGRCGGRQGAVVKARLIIGADGPRSRVAAESGLGRPRVMLGLQRTVPLRAPLHEAHLYFWDTCRYGYGWLFPKGATANLGVAVPRGAGDRARAALAELTGQLTGRGLIEVTDEREIGRGDPGRGGLIPSSGPLPRLSAGRVMLVGDAAGQTDALTGAGVVSAVRGGTMAGQAAASARRTGSWRDAGPAYESMWRRAFGRSAARSLERRYDLEARWDRDLDHAVRAAWPHDGGS